MQQRNENNCWTLKENVDLSSIAKTANEIFAKENIKTIIRLCFYCALFAQWFSICLHIVGGTQQESACHSPTICCLKYSCAGVPMIVINSETVYS